MQHNSNSPWRSPASDYPPPKPQYNLQHTISMVNLHEEPTWYAGRGPSSPTASSVSSCNSRSATPTTSNNPWSNVMSSPNSNYSAQSPNSSPKDSPNRTPQYTPRSTTPVAPQPMRPINTAGFVPMSPPPSSTGESFRSVDYPASPVNFPGSPNPYRQSVAPVAPVTPLVNGFINTSLLSSQGQSLSGWFLEHCRRQGWDAGLVKKIWQWTLSNPRLAILLVVCDDVASWRQAAFFDLRDEHLPFTEDRLLGIVSDARKVVREQWRATCKELPLTGVHVDFAAREGVPLEHAGLIRTSRSAEKSVDRVRVLGSNDDRVLVRKRLVITRASQKSSILEQINKYKQIEHKNVAKLVCSYAQPNHIGIVTERAQYSLDDYMNLPADANRPKILLDWMYDLAHALDFLHSQSICHRSIRPRKILIDGARIYFAPFDIGQTSDSFSPTVPSSQRLDQLNTYIQDQSYVYAAPEAIVSRGKRPADVFSLGCVFLSMLTVAQNQSLSIFTQYRAGSSQDASFHAHLDRVAGWRTRLHATTTSGLRNGIIGSGRKLRQLKAEADWLQVTEKMLLPKPKERIKMAALRHQGEAKTTGVRRRSLDGGGYSGQAAAALGFANSNGAPGNNGNAPQKPELSVFDGYFQQQQPRRFEQASGW
ncbi:kinase-like protein [Corynespora cassiicola Philippines]|uniref:Kinase-like protein n=1 Tax=Corynespora cassiicola Philippines TaxID=1448308 RepID=A0A2T2P1A0_CORCC|nr:kinase-like protein [Corynespora cassiicola Philippines]